jgi:hypothetical protein
MTSCLIYFRDGDTDHLVELPFDPEDGCDARIHAAAAAHSIRRSHVGTTSPVVRDNPDCCSTG